MEEFEAALAYARDTKVHLWHREAPASAGQAALCVKAAAHAEMKKFLRKHRADKATASAGATTA